MLAYFESLVEPFPTAVPDKPPRSLFGFLSHYSKPIAPHLLVVSLSASAFAVLEVALFGFLGNLVDFFADANRETFWSDHLWWMIGVGLLVLVLSFGVAVLVTFQTYQDWVFTGRGYRREFVAKRSIKGSPGETSRSGDP